jgi:hypothetical protein
MHNAGLVMKEERQSSEGQIGSNERGETNGMAHKSEQTTYAESERDRLKILLLIKCYRGSETNQSNCQN